MSDLIRTARSPMAVAAVTVASAMFAFGGVADAATTKHHTKKHHVKKHVKRQVKAATDSTTSSTSTASTAPAETELTGDAAQKAKDAAIAAVPGGTVTRASTEDSSDASGAAYEVHVTKADGTRVEVLEDASFAVLSVNAEQHGGGGCSHAAAPSASTQPAQG